MKPLIVTLLLVAGLWAGEGFGQDSSGVKLVGAIYNILDHSFGVKVLGNYA